MHFSEATHTCTVCLKWWNNNIFWNVFERSHSGKRTFDVRNRHNSHQKTHICYGTVFPLLAYSASKMWKSKKSVTTKDSRIYPIHMEHLVLRICGNLRDKPSILDWHLEQYFFCTLYMINLLLLKSAFVYIVRACFFCYLGNH